MNTSLLLLPIRRKRDLVLARQRARQIGRLVGFDLRGQLAFACGVFEAACAAVDRLGRITLEFRLCGDLLQAHCRKSPTRPITDLSVRETMNRQKPRPHSRGSEGDILLTVPMPCVQKRLPQPLNGDPQDLAWVVQKVTRRTREDLFAELQQQNSETLRALAELQRAEAKLLQSTAKTGAAAA